MQNEGQNIRKAYQRRLPSNPSKDYYFMLRETGNTDAIIVEYGFLDSKLDDVKQLKNDWPKYAEAVVKSVAAYLDIPYKISDSNENNLSNSQYQVVSGDTLWSIAKKFNTTVNEIKRLNNLSTNLLKIGSILTVSEKNNDIYTVKTGDTLYSIARLNNTTVDKLKELNNLTSDSLKIGQKIKLSDLLNDAIKYIVKSGDTLYSIASRYNTTVDKIKKINNITSNLLRIGQELLIS